MIETGMYVGISGQIAIQRRLDTIAHNVANSTAAGFRAEQTKFEALLSNAGSDPVAFASKGTQYLSRRSGEIVPTGNPLDIAIQGDAWLSAQSPAGPIYTRDGRMQLLSNGELQTLTGYSLLDSGGAPIVVNPGAGPIEISRNGVIVQNGRQIGSVGMFTIDPRANLKRYDTSGVIPDRPAEPVVDFSKTGILQGYTERSNVNPILEMANLISISRIFDSINQSIEEHDSRMRQVIQSRGPGSR